MDVPSDAIRSPLRPSEDLSYVSSGATAVSCYGRAKGLRRLLELPRLESLWISGVSSSAAEIVAQLTSLQSLVVFGWREESCELLARLCDLRSLAICQSPQLRSLSGLGALRELHSLILFDNCNYTDLSPLASLTGLETLCLEGGMSKPLRPATLCPLAGLTRLTQLRLASVRVGDRGLQPLSGLTALRDVFIADAFPESEFRSLATALPTAMGEFLDSRGRSA